MTNKEKRKANRKKRVRNFNQGMRNAPSMETYTYYYSDKNKHLQKVSAYDVKIDGIKYGTTLETLDDKLEVITNFETYVKTCEVALTSLLIEKGYNTPNVDLNALIDDISKLKIIEPNKEYVGFKLEGDYIIDYGYDVIIEKVDIPDDVTKGYYKLIDDVIEFDEQRYNEYWSGV